MPAWSSRRAARSLTMVLAAACIGCGARSTPGTEAWLAGTLTPSDSPATQAARFMVDQVRARTGGSLTIGLYDTSQLGTGQQQIEALALGTQHLYVGSGSAASILLPEYGVLDVAFLFRDRPHFDAFLASDMMAELNRRLVDEFGVRVLAMNWFRLPRYLLHRRRFITGPDDVAGSRARAPNLPMFLANWSNLGAVPVKVAFFEQYLALGQNLVELTEASGDDIHPMRLHEVAPYITDAEMMYPQASVYVAERAFRALTPEVREALRAAARDAGELHARIVTERFEADVAAIVAEGGRFAPLPPAGKRAFLEMVRAGMPRMVADGLVPRGWYERIRALGAGEP